MSLRPGGIPHLRGAAALSAYLLFARDAITCMQRLTARHGPVVGIGQVLPIGHNQIYYLAAGPAYHRRVLSDPETFQTVGLVSKGPRHSAQRRLRKGLVSMNGEQHRYYRRLLQPPLRRAGIESLAPAIAATVSAELDGWPVGQSVDLWRLCRGLLHRLSLTLLFPETGYDEQSRQVAECINQHVRMNGSRAVIGCPVNLPGTPYRRMLRFAEVTERAVLAWAGRRRDRPRDDDLLSLVVNTPDHLGAAPDDTLIAGHVPTLFGASDETCQSALFWILFLLHQHPAVARDLWEALQREDDPPLLNQVIREAMRLLPPVPYQIRKAIRDTDLVDGPIAAGSRVFLSIFLTNRAPEVWQDAARFKPDRWAAQEPTAYENPVFSAGPRVCIGTLFAQVALKESLRQILRRFRPAILPGSRIDRWISVIMAPRHAVPVVLHPADGAFAAAPLTGSVLELVDW